MSDNALLNRLHMVRIAFEERLNVAKPIAAETGLDPMAVYTVLLETKDDAALTREVCILSAQTKIDPLDLLRPASQPS